MNAQKKNKSPLTGNMALLNSPKIRNPADDYDEDDILREILGESESRALKKDFWIIYVFT